MFRALLRKKTVFIISLSNLHEKENKLQRSVQSDYGYRSTQAVWLEVSDGESNNAGDVGRWDAHTDAHVRVVAVLSELVEFMFDLRPVTGPSLLFCQVSRSD